MKRITFLAYILIFRIFFLYAATTASKENKLYVFPPQKEWKHLDTPDQRKEALQIPANVLSQISTEELLDVCFDYPYLKDIAEKKLNKKIFIKSSTF